MPILTTSDYMRFTVGNETFEGASKANRCLPNDEVRWDGSQCSLVKRASHGPIPGVLELNSKVLYGHTAKGYPIYLFHPFNKSYPPMRVGSSEKDRSKNQVALIEFAIWDEHLPRGTLIRLLGHGFKAEAEALKWLYSYPNSKLQFEPQPLIDMRPFIEGYTVNIDPDGCKDIDDVVTLRRITNGWEVTITIADVAEHIIEGSPLDLAAQKKGQTLYQDGAVVPMFPLSLSEGAGSLLPGEIRYGLSLIFHWTGTCSNFHMIESRIQNQKTYTYDRDRKSTRLNSSH